MTQKLIAALLMIVVLELAWIGISVTPQFANAQDIVNVRIIGGSPVQPWPVDVRVVR